MEYKPIVAFVVSKKILCKELHILEIHSSRRLNTKSKRNLCRFCVWHSFSFFACLKACFLPFNAYTEFVLSTECIYKTCKPHFLIASVCYTDKLI